MKVVLVGGGSGGHITPLLAVAHELKQQSPDIQISYIGEQGGAFAHMLDGSLDIDTLYWVPAGKLRRYHGESWLKRLLDVRSNWQNTRDLSRAVRGYSQSMRLLKRLQPDIVFIKGGFVGMPVGLACARLKIPYITHDSDTVPGLANRIIAKWAWLHTTGMPAEFYRYPKEKTVFVGIPLNPEYQPVTTKLLEDYRRHLKIPLDAKVLCITGGSNGAERINKAMAALAPDLLATFDDLYILHQVGKEHQGSYKELPTALKARVKELGFVPDLYHYSGAADVVITRAGATSIAELAVQQKACIVVPNPLLTGGHQLENARHLADRSAVVVLEETALAQTHKAKKVIGDLLASVERQQTLQKNIASLAQPEAAKQISELIIHCAHHKAVAGK